MGRKFAIISIVVMLLTPSVVMADVDARLSYWRSEVRDFLDTPKSISALEAWLAARDISDPIGQDGDRIRVGLETPKREDLSCSGGIFLVATVKSGAIVSHDVVSQIVMCFSLE